MKNKVSIIIVNYNSNRLLLDCLQSIYKSLTIIYEVIIVDNNSTDDSFRNSRKHITDERFIFISLNENLGFSRANNIGANMANGSFLHFLNPDTIVTETLNVGYDEVFNSPTNVYITPLINNDGTIENSKNIIPVLPNLFAKFFCPSKVKYWYIGASVIISTEDFIRIGMWNERYFMYSEDLDLFYKIHENGITIKCLNSEIFHLGGGCSQNVWNNLDRDVKKENSLYLFFKLNRTKTEYFIYKLLLFVHGLIFRPIKTLYLIKVFKRLFFN